MTRETGQKLIPPLKFREPEEMGPISKGRDPPLTLLMVSDPFLNLFRALT